MQGPGQQLQDRIFYTMYICIYHFWHSYCLKISTIISTRLHTWQPNMAAPDFLQYMYTMADSVVKQGKPVAISGLSCGVRVFMGPTVTPWSPYTSLLSHGDVCIHSRWHGYTLCPTRVYSDKILVPYFSKRRVSMVTHCAGCNTSYVYWASS